jgi:hypothetical protein
LERSNQSSRKKVRRSTYWTRRKDSKMTAGRLMFSGY